MRSRNVLRPRSRFALAWALAGMACSPLGSTLEAEVRPVRVEPTRECPTGWVSAEAGAACDALLPDAPCPAGTKPVIGSSSCQPALPGACPTGFPADPSGWGCSDLIPAAVCEGATRETVGNPQCQPIGDCAAPFPPADATLFVSAGYTAGELDATHFKSIGAAIAAAPAGARVAIESGSYLEVLTLSRSVALIGRCAAGVTLQAPVGSGVPGINVSAGKSELRGLTVKGHYNGTIVRPGAELSLTEVVYDSNQILGLRVDGKATVKDSVFRDGIPQAGKWGLGIMVQTGAQATLTSVAVTRNTQGGLVIEDSGTTVTLEGVIARGTKPRGDGTNGIGLVVADAASAEVKDSVFAENSEVGVYLASAGSAVSQLTLTRSVIRDTRTRLVGVPSPTHPGYVEYYGNNLWIVGNAKATVTHSALLRSGGASVVVGIAPASLRIEDSLIRETSPFPDGRETTAVAVQEAATLQMARCAVVRAAGVGIQLHGGSTRAEISDSVVAETRQAPPRWTGQGISVQLGARAELTRSAVVGSDGSAIMVGSAKNPGPASTCLVEGSVLAHGQGYANGTFGRGIEVWAGSQLQLHGSAVVDNREVALVISDQDSLAVVSGSVVRDTRGDGAGLVGRGVSVQSGGRLEMSDSLLARNRDVGLMVGQTGSTGLVKGGAISTVLARTSDGRFGLGAASLSEGRLELSGVRLSGHALIGLVVDRASASLERCTLASNPVALHVQNGAVLSEVASLPATLGPLEVVVTADTAFEENAIRLGAGTVPLPEALAQ